MRKSLLVAIAVTVLTVSLHSVSQAQFTPIDQPNPEYIAATTKLPTPLTFPASVVTDGSFSVTLSSPADYDRIAPGGGWATWGTPPWVEPTPTHVLYTNTNNLTMTFSRPVNIFGFEAEPNQYEAFPMTAYFYNGAALVGSVQRVVDGYGGARLFAAQGVTFDHVVFSSSDTFAIGNLRYGGGIPPVPEASTMASFGSMIGFGLLWLRRRLVS